MTLVSLSKPEVVIFQPWIEIATKFGLIDFDLLKCATSPNPKPEVLLRRRSNCDEFKNDKNNHITVIGILFCISLPAPRATRGGLKVRGFI